LVTHAWRIAAPDYAANAAKAFGVTHPARFALRAALGANAIDRVDALSAQHLYVLDAEMAADVALALAVAGKSRAADA
jgi:hypothetical protein